MKDSEDKPVPGESALASPPADASSEPQVGEQPAPAGRMPRAASSSSRRPPHRVRPRRPTRSRTAPRAPAARSPDPTTSTSLGAEAAPHPTAAHPPPPEYGRRLDREMRADVERRGLVDEFRLVERWVRERIEPPAEPAERRRLPLEFVWRHWRELAMRDRSDSVDEFGRD